MGLVAAVKTVIVRLMADVYRVDAVCHTLLRMLRMDERAGQSHPRAACTVTTISVLEGETEQRGRSLPEPGNRQLIEQPLYVRPVATLVYP